MRYFLLSVLIPFIILAGDISDENNDKPTEKVIDTINPVSIEKLDKEVKSEKDIKKAIKKGAGEKDGVKTIDPHNFKDVKDNKIDAHNISNKENNDEIDPTKFMQGLGDKPNEDKKKNDKKRNIITPNSNTSPYDNSKRLVQNINSQKSFISSIGNQGNLHLFFNIRDDKNDSGQYSEMKLDFNYTLYKRVDKSSFRITVGSLSNKLNTDLTEVSLSKNNSIGIKEAYYLYRNDKIFNLKLGKFFSPFKSDYFFSKSVKFTGIELYGKLNNGLFYRLLGSNIDSIKFNNNKNINIIGVMSTGFNNDNINITLSYTLLYGKNLNNLFTALTNGENYEKYNHYISGKLSYYLKLKSGALLSFETDGSYNLSKSNDNYGISFKIKHDCNKKIAEIGLLYKGLNSVISPLSLQNGFLSTNVIAGYFKVLFKFSENMKLGTDFNISEFIKGNDEINYQARIVYSVDF